MVLWLFFIVAAFSAPIANGFHRLHVDPAQTVWTPTEAQEGPEGDLGLHNPYTRTATVSVGGIRVGTVRPQATATLTNIPAGVYRVTWQVPTRPAFQSEVQTHHAD